MYFTICINEGQTHICNRDFNLAYYLEVENMVLPVFNLFITRGSNVQPNMNVSWSTFTLCFTLMHLQYFGLNVFLALCIGVCLCVFSDQHMGVCFASVVNGRCAQEIRGRFSKIQCCCDRGRCWSQRTALQMCPVPGSGD